MHDTSKIQKNEASFYTDFILTNLQILFVFYILLMSLKRILIYSLKYEQKLHFLIWKIKVIRCLLKKLLENINILITLLSWATEFEVIITLL